MLFLYEFVYICFNLNGYILILCFKSLVKKLNLWLNFYEVELLFIVCMYGLVKDFLLQFLLYFDFCYSGVDLCKIDIFFCCFKYVNVNLVVVYYNYW